MKELSILKVSHILYTIMPQPQVVGHSCAPLALKNFTYNTDGTLPQINMTLAGPAQVGHLNPYDTTQAETTCWASGIKNREMQ